MTPSTPYVLPFPTPSLPFLLFLYHRHSYLPSPPSIHVQVWPVSHVIDTANLYLQILRIILTASPTQLTLLGSGKTGYYLASSGLVSWSDIYASFARSLFSRGLISTPDVSLAGDKELEEIAKVLRCEKDEVAVQVGGRCGFVAEHGERIGWTSRYKKEHVLESADEEVGLILKYI